MFKQILIGLLYSAQVLSINLLLLKGTTAVLPENLKKYALYHGVPFAELLAENYYIAGPQDIRLRINYEIKHSQQSGADAEQAKLNLEQYEKDLKSNESYTSRLVAQLYYRPVGGQFQMIAAQNNPVIKLQPGHIGNILRIIEQSLGKEKAALEADLKNYLVSLKFQKTSGSLFKANYFKHFVDSLVGSLQECDKSNVQPVFAPGTTEGILLGYCLNKSNTKADLEDYLKGLTGQNISLPDQQYSQEEMKQIINQGMQLKDTDKFADWLTCATYHKKYKAPFPKIVSNKTVSYDGVSFPDCVETTVRNLCNIATYDGSSLGVVPKGIEPSSSLENFYKQGKANIPAEVGNDSVYQSWTDVIENMPGASYMRLKLQGRYDVRLLPVEYEGFIPVDDSLISQSELTKLSTYKMNIAGQDITLYEKAVGGVKYLLVQKNSNLLCYDLSPTASNIVVCLNNLFKLNLYDSKSIFTQDFVQNNFKKVCDKFDWNLQTPVTDNVQSIDIKICKYNTCFTIGLWRKAHGAVTVLNSVASNSINQDDITADLYKKYPEKISEILFLFDTVDISKLFDQVDKNVAYFLPLLKNINIINPDRRVKVLLDLDNFLLFVEIIDVWIDNYVSDLIMGLPLHDSHYIKAVIDQSIINVSDKIKNSLKSFWDLYFLKEGISSATVEIFCALAKRNIVNREQVVPFLEKVMISGNADIQSTVISELKYLGERKILSSQQIRTFLEKGIATGNKNLQQAVMNSLRYLGKEKILDSQQIVTFLENIIATGNENVQQAAMNSFLDLGRAKILDSQQIITFLKKRMATGNENAQETVIKNLYILGYDKVLDSQQIVTFLEKGMATGNENLQQAVMNHLQYLGREKILDSQQIVTFLEKGMVIGNENVQEVVIRDLCILGHDKILDSQQIVTFLEKGMASIHESIQHAVINSLLALGRANILDSQQIVTFLEKGIATGNENVQEAVMNQLIYLGIEKILDSQQIIALLEKGMATSNLAVQKEVLEQLQDLGRKKILNSQDIVMLLKKIMISGNKNIRTYLMNKFEDFEKEKILTPQEVKEIKEIKALGLVQGWLKKVGILSMRHDPYALSDYMADWAGKQHAGYFEKLKQGYQSQTPGLDVKHLDLESEKQKLLEQQQMMQPTYEKLYETEHVGKPGNIQPIQNIMPFIAQQRQANKIALPKVANIAKGALRTGVRR